MDNRKSTQDYWNNNWKHAGEGIKPNIKKNFLWKRLDSAFREIFKSIETKNLNLIEIGAGASEWLPRMHFDYEFKVSGIDYSNEGCERARNILKESKIEGEIFYLDMFEKSDLLEGKYDVVCSFGLVEHFNDTVAAINACAKFLKPGGIIITLIPNMTGLTGFFYKTLNRKVFDTHVPLKLTDLVEAHKELNLEVYYQSYILGLPSVIDDSRVETGLVKKCFRRVANKITTIIWWFESRGFGVPENNITSPYMICAAKVSSD